MINLKDLPKKKILEGFEGQFVHTENTTLAYWEVKKGAVLPMHSHFHEQITQIIEGQFELTIGEQTQVCKIGELAVIPPNKMHGGRALTDCKIFDIFSPVREDYKG